MAPPDDELPFGLYERLLTQDLTKRLLQFDAAQTRVVTAPVDPAEVHSTLGRHLQRIVTRALASLPGDEHPEKATAITNELIRLLAWSTGGADQHGEAIGLPPAELRQIVAVGDIALTESVVQRPLVPLSASDLMVNARGEPALATALAREIPSADSIDLLCAFVRWHGLRVIQDTLGVHLRAGRPMRVITTVYTGSTERKALDWLVQHGAQVKVSYDTQSTRLHAKAWLFRRNSGFSTTYIGSSNLSKSALVDGVEWNVRLSEVTSADVLDKFDATFESYWASPEYEAYDPGRDADRFDRAVRSDASVSDLAFDLNFLDVRPWPHQVEMLEKLAVERERHHRYRNLVVAATGTGKTIVAALDFQRLRLKLGDPRLLFVAHRREILRQSLGAFRQVLRDGEFGELYVDGHRPDEWRHVFASIQSLDRIRPEDIAPTAFDIVIVDEFHRAGAPTYQRLLNHLSPKVLLGLTATPERSDSEDILGYFDNRIAVELRLWDALERGLLCPFHYFGLHDNTDLSAVRWSRGGYETADLDRLYTGNDARVKLVLQELHDKHRSPGQMRALGFCISVEHAKYMAARFTDAGLLSRAVWADTPSDERKAALVDLGRGRIRALFSVDLFNEGIDIPEVDTLLMLRPTESALVFMQQLGRGLRRHDSKDCVTILDFIGQAHRKFRFDLRYRAVTGTTRTEVEKQITEGFPFLPAGCSMRLDRVASQIVLDNLKDAIPSQRQAMVRELRALLETDRFRGKAPDLAAFLSETGLELEDVYRRGSWSSLKRAAGIGLPVAGPDEVTIGDQFEKLLHIDDPLRLEAYRRVFNDGVNITPSDSLLLSAFVAMTWGRAGPATIAEALAAMKAHQVLVDELAELMQILESRATHLTYPIDGDIGWSHGVPLSVHARHTQAEVLSAFGRLAPGKFFQIQSGVYRDDRTNSDLFFATLEKSERDYSPTTLYKDYAISPNLFHWESQSITTQQSSTGQRYIRHVERDGHILLFVRQRAKNQGRTVPYTFLGPADHVSHKGERPISFVWNLRRPMPADFFRQAKVAAG